MHFVMTFEDSLIFTCEATAVTLGPIIITSTAGVTGSGPGSFIITSTAVVLARTWRRNWMLETVRGGDDIRSSIYSLLERLSYVFPVTLWDQNMRN